MNDQVDWMEINDRHLAATVEWIRLRLRELALLPEDSIGEEPRSMHGGFEQHETNTKEDLPSVSSVQAAEALKIAHENVVECEKNDPPPALILLAKNLSLSKFDRDVLALCAAMELDTRIAGLCAKAQDDPNKLYPTFALAFTLFEDPDWNTLSPHAPLRHWRLLEINQPGTQPLTSASLGADERIVNYLKGLNYLDDRLTPLLDPIEIRQADEKLPPSQDQIVDIIIQQLRHSNGTGRTPVIELLGHDSASKRLVAGRVSSALDSVLYKIDLNTLPNQTGDFETFTRLWQRESLLMPLALYIDKNGAGELEKTQLKRFLERSNGVVFLDVEGTKAEFAHNRFSIDINKPTPEEQDQLWTEALHGQAMDQSKRLAEQFSFNQSEIKRLAEIALDRSSEDERSSRMELWQACRIAARAEMEQLAQRIDAKARWDQLILPPEQKALLNQIIDQVACRNRVYEDWGFRQRMNRGLGINALFAGESGTGKTMAAEVIANALELDLYRIDLSAVVSKYIGETEKNLRKLFDAAEDSGAILFFDEADALFGKRSEVKDSHDRYANIEINFLLQRMESYRGLAILATNMKTALDKAFVRRLRFIVDFPFPTTADRKRIWQKVFPAKTPIDENYDCQRLAELSLTGGSIHNVALNAAFLAAQKGSPVTMPLVLDAARIEFKKLERPAKETNFALQSSLEVVQ